MFYSWAVNCKSKNMLVYCQHKPKLGQWEKCFLKQYPPPFMYRNFRITTTLEGDSEMEATYFTFMLHQTHINAHTHLWVMQWGWQGQCPDDPPTPSGKLLSEIKYSEGTDTERKRETGVSVLHKSSCFKVNSLHYFYRCIECFKAYCIREHILTHPEGKCSQLQD